MYNQILLCNDHICITKYYYENLHKHITSYPVTDSLQIMSDKEVEVSEDILNVIQSGQVKNSASNKLSLLM